MTLLVDSFHENNYFPKKTISKIGSQSVRSRLIDHGTLKHRAEPSLRGIPLIFIAWLIKLDIHV